jgi:hypothetical protein
MENNLLKPGFIPPEPGFFFWNIGSAKRLAGQPMILAGARDRASSRKPRPFAHGRGPLNFVLKEVFRMKHAAIALAVAILALAARPILAETPVEPAVPPDAPPVVTPNDAYAAPPLVVVPVPDNCKNTGAANPCTPDPTRNTPGAESKN